jgi:hypothetical protein
LDSRRHTSPFLKMRCALKYTLKGVMICVRCVWCVLCVDVRNGCAMGVEHGWRQALVPATSPQHGATAASCRAPPPGNEWLTSTAHAAVVRKERVT